MHNFLFLFFLLFLTACAKNSQEKVDEAIDLALTYLSKEDCDEAIDVLLDSGGDSSNGLYVEVLASAYACKASFDEISFVSTELSVLDTTSAASIFKSLSILSSANETVVDSTAYVGIWNGIKTILYSTTGTPGQVARTTKFGSRRAGALGIQTLLLSFANLGRFLHYYGNVSSLGVKGGGTATNKCFINYNDPRAGLVIAGNLGGACNSTNSGHQDLDQSTTTGKRRLCEGLMLVTNILDILPNIDVSGSSDLTILTSISTKVSSFKTAAIAAGLGTLINMTSPSTCETHLQTAANLLDMEYMYALLFETGLQ